MKDQYLRNKFIFSKEVDATFLYSLYEDDYSYMEEIFKTTLDQLHVDLPAVSEAFEKGDIKTLRRYVHKIKPAFGFTGFLSIEQACKQFEAVCDAGASIQILTKHYYPLWNLLKDSVSLMRSEYNKLKEYNAS